MRMGRALGSCLGEERVGAEGREIGQPPGIMPAAAEYSPRRPARRNGLPAQPPAELADLAVSFDVIAPSAGRHDVVPRVKSPAAAGDDVVDARRGRTAVDGPAGSPGKNSAPGKRYGRTSVRDSDESGQPNDRGCGKRDPLTVQDQVRFLERHRPLRQYEHDGTPLGHGAQGLVRRVQDQRVGHGASSWQVPARGSRRAPGGTSFPRSRPELHVFRSNSLDTTDDRGQTVEAYSRDTLMTLQAASSTARALFRQMASGAHTSACPLLVGPRGGLRW